MEHIQMAVVPYPSISGPTFTYAIFTVLNYSTKPPIFSTNFAYIKDFYFVDRFHGPALHGDRCDAGCEANTNFADDSASLTTGTIQMEVAAMHKPRVVLKMVSL
jgi:hypothetical protein